MRRGLVPVGYLITVGLVGAGIASAIRPPFRSWPLGLVTWIVSAIPSESPFLAFYWVVGATALTVLQGDLYGPWAWAGVAVAALTLVGIPILVRRSLRATDSVERGLDEGLGEGWRQHRRDGGRSRSLPWARIIFAPVPLFHPGLRRRSNLSYGDAGRRNRLDLYRRRRGGARRASIDSSPRGGSSLAPGRKSFYARRLLFRLARQGWVCISATYRLRPEATFPVYLTDVKKVIAWARAHAVEHGGDPDRIILSGSCSALTSRRPRASRETTPSFNQGSRKSIRR